MATSLQLKVQGISFGDALKYLQSPNSAFSIVRAGDAPKGILIGMEKGAAAPDAFDKAIAFGESQIEGIALDLFEKGDYGIVTRLPHLVVFTESGCIVNGWLPSQADLCACDWQVFAYDSVDWAAETEGGLPD